MTNKFRSCLGNDLQDFLEFQRSLGMEYFSVDGLLHHFDRFVMKTVKEASPIDLKTIIEGWLATFQCKPATIMIRFTIIRKFCLFLRRRDPNGFVPDRDIAPRVYKSRHLPHIFTPAQIARLLCEIDKMQNRSRAHAYRAILLLLYCTGLRPGEAVRLRIRDVDLRDKVLLVENSKRKSRWVPFEASLAKELSDYRRERLKIGQASQDSRFFVQPNGSPFPVTTISTQIRRFLRQAGMKPQRGRVGPRPYDTRHSYAVNRLTEWYREGIDVQERLAWLSAYLGHNDLLATQDYLHLTPELRRMISVRHENYIERCWGEER